MLLYGAISTRCSMICPRGYQAQASIRKAPISLPSTRISAGHTIAAVVAATAAAVVVLSACATEVAAPPQQPGESETLSNIPQTLSSECTPEQNCKKRYKIQRPKSKKAENCTSKCVGTCIQGGFGSPGEGPFNIRRDSDFPGGLCRRSAYR